MTCPWCDGLCEDADLDPLLQQNLRWLWDQLARAGDKRGDAALADGTLIIRAPVSAEHRAAAAGLLGGYALRASQSRRLDLADLTRRLRIRGEHLTPGAVAAHAVGRRLALKATAKHERLNLEAAIATQLNVLREHLPEHIRDRVPADPAQRLKTSGWLTKVANHATPGEIVAGAFAVLCKLPVTPSRVDRRTLVPGDPHALDTGRLLPGLILALTDLTMPRARQAWDVLGVNYDDLLGGLIAIGIVPAGWILPTDAVVTLPPRELARIEWEPPTSPGEWIFVTENPSVLSAAAGLAAARKGPSSGGGVRMVCTAGTPSATEALAVGALTDVGWNVAVRADFDPSGLSHVRSLLAGAPKAAPWRMTAADYRLSVRAATGPMIVRADAAPWDPDLARTMIEIGAPAYEEELLPQLLEDVANGRPTADLPEFGGRG